MRNISDDDSVGTNEARTDALHTLKDTINRHQDQTPPTTSSSVRNCEKAGTTVVAGVVDVDWQKSEGENALVLPADLQDGLVALGWADTSAVVMDAYRQNPGLVRDWLDFALRVPEKDVKRSRVGLFRKGLGSGQRPPYRIQKPAPPLPIPGFDETVAADDLAVADGDEPVRPWPEIPAKVASDWEALLIHLQQQERGIPQAAFREYLRDTRPVGYDAELRVYTIGVHSPYARDWIDGRLKSTVINLLGGIANASIKVEFVVWR